MLVTMKDILSHANRHNYGVMAMNSINLEMVRAGIQAAEEERSAIIIQMGPNQIKQHATMSDVVPLVKNLAERATIPVALNLDHGSNLDVIISALQAGFTNVMFDGSSLPFEENVEKTELVVALAHSMGVTVEAELGHVGQAVASDNHKADFLTNVEQAREFVERTGVDALAVAVGTAHGDYPKGQIPVLDFERLRQLKTDLKMPLVLHGGSGAGEANLKEAVRCGINKINACTDVFSVGKETMKELLDANPSPDYLGINVAIEKNIKTFVRDYMRVIGSSGRYSYSDTLYTGHE